MTANLDVAAPLDTLLAGYSAGSLSSAMHALVGAHLEICDRNRSFVAALDGAKGKAVLASVTSEPEDRDSNLAKIFAIQSLEPARIPDCSVLPAPLQEFVGGNYDALKWKAILPGFWHYQVTIDEGATANFYKIKAGRKIPVHTHEGSEITLVLRGAFHDNIGTYARGDIAFADSDVNHQPIAGIDEDCICFAVTDAPLHLTGPFGRMVDRLFGRRH